MTKKLWIALLALTVLTGLVQPIYARDNADGIVIIDPPPEPPPDWEPWLTLRHHRVTVTIEDQIATTQVDQVFRNDGSMAAEGTYVFPLPPNASVQRFVMWVDGEPVEGEILPADEARAIYEGYVQRRRDPALLEYVGRDAVRAHIFPIPPGEERRIQLEYQEILPRTHGLLHYHYPLDTQRFSAAPVKQISIHVMLRSGSNLKTVYSPTHQNDVHITRHSAHHVTLSYESRQLLPGRDFELYAGSDAAEIGAHLLSYRNGDEDGFFLLAMTPALADEVRAIVPRDILMVLDTSGSMDGEKLDQAKRALDYILQRLNPEDRFNVIAFSSDVNAYAPTLQSPARAPDAVDWVDGREALGGTNISLALSLAMAQLEGDRPAVVIFLTDGLPTEGIVEEAALLAAVASEAAPTARLFTFGVGYDVNTLLLDQLAQDHKGRSAYVEPHERIDDRVATFYTQIQSPVLTDITLDFGDVQTYDVVPTPLPDLYAGTQLILTGRYRLPQGHEGDKPRRIGLTGQVAGEPATYNYEGTFVATGGPDFIPRLWATRKVGHLLTQIRLHGETPEWVDAVVTLSTRYGIITPYTSFLIEDPDESLSSEGRDRATEELEKTLAPLPAAGESAVDDAVMREGLGGAEAAPSPDESFHGPDASPVVRYRGDKTFFCTAEGLCTDTTYIPDKMEIQEVTLMSPEYWALIDAYPSLNDAISVSPSTIVVAPDGVAYHVHFGPEAEEVARPTTIPTATAPSTAPVAANPTPTSAAEDPQPPSEPPAACAGALPLVGLSVLVVLWEQRRRRASQG
jgi:Ca-activated chloride channel family protein